MFFCQCFIVDSVIVMSKFLIIVALLIKTPGIAEFQTLNETIGRCKKVNTPAYCASHICNGLRPKAYNRMDSNVLGA